MSIELRVQNTEKALLLLVNILKDVLPPDAHAEIQYMLGEYTGCAMILGSEVDEHEGFVIE